MSLPNTTDGYEVGPDEGEALWFNGALLLVKASADQTGGRFAAVEFVATKGFASPQHIHQNDDEFFLVLSGQVRFQLGGLYTKELLALLSMGLAASGTLFTSTRKRPAYSCFPDRRVSRGSSARVASLLSRAACRPPMSSSSTGKT